MYSMSPKISIICEKERQQIGEIVSEKLERIGYNTEIQWQEDEGLKTSFYHVAAVVACVSSTNANKLHLVAEIERAVFVQTPIIAVLIDPDFDPNDQEWLSIMQMIKATAMVDLNQENEFERYFDELYREWTRSVPEKDRVEKGTGVKDEDFQGDDEETDDKDHDEDKEDNWKDGKEVDEDDSLDQNENEDEISNEREVENEDIATVNAPVEDENRKEDEDIEKEEKEDEDIEKGQKEDEDIEKGQKEDEETEDAGTTESKDKEKEKENQDLDTIDASSTKDTLPNDENLPNEDTSQNEDIAADLSTTPNDEIGSSRNDEPEETIPLNEDNEQEKVTDEDDGPEIALEEGEVADKAISSADYSTPEEDITPVDTTEQDVTIGWEYSGNENFTHIDSTTELQGDGI